MTRIDPTTLAKAREWVEKDFVTEAHFRAAAEVIAALPDGWIDADKLRETIEFHRDRLPHGVEEDLESLLPAPTPRTLADMTEEERKACRWMQAKVPDLDTPVVILQVWGNGCALLSSEGVVEIDQFPNVTPRPDLPRMVWPDEHHPETTEVEEGTYGQARWEMVTKSIRGEKEYAIDAQDYDGAGRWRDVERALGAARGIDLHKEPSTQPRPEDVPAGEVWVVSYRDGRAVGMREYSEYRPWYVMWDNQDLQIEGLWLGDKDITLVSRLVPEVQA